jgi:hypothetical protein
LVGLSNSPSFGKSGAIMRLPFLGPRRGEIAATAADLITRFGLRAHEEAAYLAELATQMHSRRRKVLYELVAREIEASFVEAKRRLGARERRSDTARPDTPQSERYDGGADPVDGTEPHKFNRLAPRVPAIPRTANVQTSLVADLNLVDVNPSPRRRFGSR